MSNRFQQPKIVECTAGCGRTVSVDATTCPNCGEPDPARIGGMTRAEIDWWNSPEGQKRAKEEQERRADWRRQLEDKKLANKKEKRWFHVFCLVVLIVCGSVVYQANSFISVFIAVVVGFFMIQGLLNSSVDDD